ncbi:hypothetical protein FACS1894195_1670 [Bacteroidia bacterium]|nr:hypothetical protein FACS1894195_1670 [Bacteroidia bacterium]
MGQTFELDRENIIRLFPGLTTDTDFQITSKASHRYNCIAWAYKYDDRWMEYGGKYELDGVIYWWPDGVNNTPYIDAYADAFKLRGYEFCESWLHESDYEKIALYVDKEQRCTHAAREKRNGTWTSKLGKSNDISHNSPYSIEGDFYGRVECIMKRKWE